MPRPSRRVPVRICRHHPAHRPGREKNDNSWNRAELFCRRLQTRSYVRSNKTRYDFVCRMAGAVRDQSRLLWRDRRSLCGTCLADTRCCRGSYRRRHNLLRIPALCSHPRALLGSGVHRPGFERGDLEPLGISVPALMLLSGPPALPHWVFLCT